MFMNQLTVFEMDEITAYGIFNINLNLVMSVSRCKIYCFIYNNINIFFFK